MWIRYLKPKVVKIVLGLLGLILLLAFLEFCWFWAVLKKVPGKVTADVVVVFGGSHARTVKGYDLVNRGYAHFLIVSPASDEYLKRLDKTYRNYDTFQYIVEDRAETTFQNALLVSELIRRQEMRSVLLVTTDYHMPRSLLLMRFWLMTEDVKIDASPVVTRPFSVNPFRWSGLQKKMVYNEMVQLWGSLGEMGLYAMTGRLPERGVKRNRDISWLRSVLLFDISQS